MPISGPTYVSDAFKLENHETVIDNLLRWLRVKRKQLAVDMERLASDLEYYMKSRHPWENRTGFAEESLTARLETTENYLYIDLFYDDEIIKKGDRQHRPGGPRNYGQYLEGYLGLGILEETLDEARSTWQNYLVEI